jgi:hypothetical protein
VTGHVTGRGCGGKGSTWCARVEQAASCCRPPVPCVGLEIDAAATPKAPAKPQAKPKPKSAAAAGGAAGAAADAGGGGGGGSGSTPLARAHSLPHHLPSAGKHGVKILSWNVNGLRAVVGKGSLQSFVAAEQPDVLILSETKVDDSLTGSVGWFPPFVARCVGWSRFWFGAGGRGDATWLPPPPVGWPP